MDDDFKIKPFTVILQKASAYVKRYDVETKWMYFLTKDDEFLKNPMPFEEKSAIVLKRNMIANPFTIKNF